MKIEEHQAVEKTGIIGTDQVYLFDIYIEIAKDISGYDAGSFSLYDSKNQCMISELVNPVKKNYIEKLIKLPVYVHMFYLKKTFISF
jgi:hypothetical protein